jgi:uncharacterized delta-60 repeat protein
MPLHPTRRLFASSRRNTPARSTHRPALEHLEERCTPSVAGVLDRSFATNGKATFNFNVGGATMDNANAVAAQPDGKVVVVGTVVANGISRIGVIRYDRDGTIDPTFATGALSLGGFGVSAGAVAIQPDGKVVIGGSFFPNRSYADFLAVRLNADGSLDTTFASGGSPHVDLGFGLADEVRGIAVQPDGKIVLAGSLHTMNDVAFGVVRLNRDGSLDASFDGQGYTTYGFEAGNKSDYASSVLIQKGGKIVVGGTVGSNDFALSRLNANGTLDETFGLHGKAIYNVGTGSVSALAAGPDGKLVLVGSAVQPGKSDPDFALVRTLPNGALDPSFNLSGILYVAYDLSGRYKSDYGNSVVVQPDGKIVVAGTVTFGPIGNTDMVVERFNLDGSYDKTFNDHGWQRVSFDSSETSFQSAHAMALTPDGIVVVGWVPSAPNEVDFAVARLVRDQWVVAGAGQGSRPLVRVLTPTGTLLKQFYAFNPALSCGVRAAVVYGYGLPVIIAAPGEGGPPVVRIYDGASLKMIRQTVVAAPTFHGGVNIAVGKVVSQDLGEILVGLGRGALPLVKVYSVATGALLGQFLAYSPSYRGGVRVAAADVLGDALKDIVFSRQDGSSPIITALDYATGARKNYRVAPGPVAGGFDLASGHVNGAGKDDLIVGFGSGAGLVKVFNGLDGSLLQSYPAFGPAYRGGVHVSALDLDGDGYDDVLTAALLRGVSPRDPLAAKVG